jgi:hypothetical protein
MNRAATEAVYTIWQLFPRIPAIGSIDPYRWWSSATVIVIIPRGRPTSAARQRCQAGACRIRAGIVGIGRAGGRCCVATADTCPNSARQLHRERPRAL